MWTCNCIGYGFQGRPKLDFLIPNPATDFCFIPPLSESLSRSRFVKFSKGHLLFKFRILQSISKLSCITPPIEISASRSRQAIFIPYTRPQCFLYLVSRLDFKCHPASRQTFVGSPFSVFCLEQGQYNSLYLSS